MIISSGLKTRYSAIIIVLLKKVLLKQVSRGMNMEIKD